MKKIGILSSLAILALSSSAFASVGGVAVGATRVIYKENMKETSLTVSNKNQSQYFLVQSWVDDKDGNKKVPFVITPPLFRLNANKENMLRIVKKSNDGVPTDRESVYWLNIKSIPPAPENAENQNILQLAIKTRIKLFYRPNGLPGSAETAPESLTWSQQGNDLVATNPSAYAVTLSTLKVDGKTVSCSDMVLPKSATHYPLPAGAGHVNRITFTTINDFGGVTAEINSSAR